MFVLGSVPTVFSDTVSVIVSDTTVSVDDFDDTVSVVLVVVSALTSISYMFCVNLEAFLSLILFNTSSSVICLTLSTT